jgi:GDPmannose 4,6-dehydratase
MARALITGVTGQDGTYLSQLLLDRGYEVHGVVKPGDDGGRPPVGIEQHTADLADNEALRRIVFDVEPDELYNLGGLTSVAGSWADPLTTVAVTGAPVATLLDAAFVLHERGLRVAVVQASSAEIFGLAAESPQSESTPIAPVSPYGAAKALGHFLVGAFRSRGLRASSAILYNHESPLRPETFVTRKITASAARIARGRQQTLSLGSLDAERDWGWAPDYVDALHRMMQQPTGGDFVIGTGEAHSVRDFVRASFAAAGVDDWQSHVKIDPAFVRAADPARQLADPSKAARVLGWRPTCTFDELVARLVHADLAALDSESA